MPLKKEKSEEIASSSNSDSSEDSPAPKLKVKMADKITLSFLTKFIKPYNGDRESLPAFLTNCENAIALATTEQQNVLCKYIISQLEGKAQLACCLRQFKSWSEIKQFLRTTFGEKKHSTHLLVDLQQCKQLPSEDVMQFSIRIESCLTRLQADIHYSCENDKELVGRIAAMEDLALNTFLLGLNFNFSHIVRCRNPKTLSEAITNAIEEEKIFNLSKLSIHSNKQCTTCNKSGHVTSECYKNKNKRFSANSYHVNTANINEHDNSNTNQYSNSNFDPNKFCAYCKKRGHLIGECRKLKAKNNNNLRTDPRNSTLSSATAPNANNVSSNNHSNVHHVDTSNENDSLN